MLWCIPRCRLLFKGVWFFVGSAVGFAVKDLVGVFVGLLVGDSVGEVLGSISLRKIDIAKRVVGSEACVTFLLKCCGGFRDGGYFLKEFGFVLARQ